MSVAEIKATLSDPLVLLDMEIERHSPAGFTVECSQSVFTAGGAIHLALKMFAQ